MAELGVLFLFHDLIMHGGGWDAGLSGAFRVKRRLRRGLCLPWVRGNFSFFKILVTVVSGVG